MSQNIDLAALGISKEEIEKRIVDAVAESVLSDVGYDEGGDETFGESAFHKKTRELIQKRIDTAIAALAEKHVLPNVDAHIENLVLQETTKWGEKVGKPLTIVEYLVSRCNAYMLEEVNYDGKTKGQDSYNWRPTGARVARMIDQYLHHHIEIAMKEAVQNANSNIAKGIQETVRIKLAEIAAKLKVEVKTS